MPASSLFTASAEAFINNLIALDEDSEKRLSALSGKRLTLFLEGLPWGVTLAFSSKVDILLEHHSYEDVSVHVDESTCYIKTHFDALPSLTQTSQITQLIREGKLQMQGEPGIAQQVAALFQQLDIDWEEQLSKYTGDVPAHQIFSGASAFKAQMKALSERFTSGLSNAITEEKDIAVGKLAVMHFNDEVDALRDDVQRFEARLRLLENSL
ncbi:ubiquinone biosynthesis accessory factor UbiJ [Salinimonas iocasae]|uniref:Ubiquinone biosynthesis accessory factor UbiJ n=1 Tax=Salinimonas iocasae TaxID=2572577 RepID=A0A5B7Y9P7_9ALTE|nr:SCP2 sterol-binding domain-containing protein [Salinimonas iocasae]QCZ92362.1 hypothetical protein FBQ74_02215 [Salinimonas iocasae]